MTATLTAPALASRTRNRAALSAIGMTLWASMIVWPILMLVMAIPFVFVSPEATFEVTMVTGAPQVFLFIMGILTGATYLTVALTSGLTRRSLIEGWALAAVVLGVVTAVIQFVVEGLFDWLWGLTHAVDVTASFDPRALGAMFLVNVVAYLTGVAVHANYRVLMGELGVLGGWLGTLTLIPVLVPLAVAVLATRLGQGAAGVQPGVDIGLGWLWAVLAVVAAAGMVWALLRRIAIR